MNTLLEEELKKEKYLSLTDAQALAALPVAEQKIGRIQGDDKLDLMTFVMESGLRDQWLAFIETNKTSQDVQIQSAVYLAGVLHEGLDKHLLMQDLYRINLGLAKVKGMFDGALFFGLITQEQYNTILALATYTLDDFGHFTVEDIAAARLMGQRPQDTINYPNAAAHYTKRAGKNVDIFAYLQAPAATDVVIDIFALQRSNNTRPFVGNGVRQGFIKIAKGESGGVKTLNHSFTEQVQFNLISNVNVAFTVDVVDA